MPPRDTTRLPLIVPEFGIRDVPLAVSLWLVPRGAAVVKGHRVVELLAGGVTIDLEAPVTGRLVAQHVDEDATVAAGMVVGEIEASS